MGSPATEEGRSGDERQHKKRIGRTFAIAAKALTVKDFQRFLKGDPEREEWFQAGGQAAPLMKKYCPELDCPIILIDWYHAAAYCNWLSEQEGIAPEQWCYETDERGRVTKLKDGYLGLAGYRLPTEAEMEYACRAGAVTSRYYGETGELLPHYAWYLQNSQERTWPVGGKKPNDLGLFDAHGNVWAWCQEKYENYPKGQGEGRIEDKEDSLTIKTEDSRVLRGGAFIYRASDVRSARRFFSAPAFRDGNVGFRPARTFTP
jgi:formylglycine-generating enzyme required for sulfatase activity